jgi:hypothetical protein
VRVLVACEESGIVRDAFRRHGHDAWSCDLKPSRGMSVGAMHRDVYPVGHRMDNQQYQCDVRELFPGGRLYQQALLEDQQPVWDLIIAHPVCTRLTNAGVRWLAPRNLWDDMRAGAEFFNFFKGKAPRVCIENPVMHKYAAELCGPWAQTFQPWQFGEPQFKRTCLWLENLPPLKHTNVLTPPKPGTDEHKAWSKVHRCPPGANRAEIRSTFFVGVADAMAEQWGSLG